MSGRDEARHGRGAAGEGRPHGDEGDASRLDIAIVGMAGRFPGARDLRTFWANLRDGVESLVDFDDDALRAAGVPDAVLRDPLYVKRGAVLDDVEGFDAELFGFTPRDAAVLDPQHRHFLECAWAALEDAGHMPRDFGGTIGVYAGVGMGSYLAFNLLPDPALMASMGLFLVRHTGNDKDFLATRVSYELDLTGPSVNVQTACSTSLVAVHLAVQALLNGETDMALAGGATIELPHRRGYLYKEGEILSRDGRCRAFDASAGGTVFGSGAGIVVLRRLADALADGDTIRAVIRGSAINNDGASKVGYLAPSVDGQARAIAEALAVADVDPETIGYVEAHGTGTSIGDPIEVAALTQAYRAHTDRRQYCAIGSLKPNIGHLDTAAGVASLIKTVLALEHRQIPPTLHFRTPNPECRFESSPFFVNATLRDWTPIDGVRRAGVSSLGVGGTNAHLIVEEAPRVPARSARRRTQLLLVDARTTESVQEAALDLAAHLESEPELQLADVAWSLQVGRRSMSRSLVVVADVAAGAAAALRACGPADMLDGVRDGVRREVAFMFAGGGAQYAGMGRALHAAEPVFREALDECLRLIAPQLDTDLAALLFPAPGEVEAAQRELERPSRALPALFAVQYAQARLWMSWGVRPSAMIGHSMGEYTAACLAGVLTLADALALVAFRGRLFERVPPGAMVSVPLAADALRPLLGQGLSLSAANAPGLSVAGGPVAAIDALVARLAGLGIESRRVHISVAAHSSMLDPFLDEFGRFVAGFALGTPSIPIVSNLTGTWLTDAQARDPAYWVRHLRDTVRFADGLATLALEDDSVLLEVGPGRTLASLARAREDEVARRVAITSMPHSEETGASASDAMLRAVGRLRAAGASIDWRAFHDGEPRRRVPLPTYPFEQRRHWIDAPAAVAAEGATPTGDAAAEAPLEERFHQPAWQPAPPPTPPDASRARPRLLLLCGGGPLDAAVRAAATAVAREVVTVEAGAAFETVSAGHVRIRVEERADHARLFSMLAAQGARPDAIVDLLDLRDAPADPEAQDPDRAFAVRLALIQGLADADCAEDVAWVAAAAHLHLLPGDERVVPSRALALGVLTVAPQEWPGVRCTSVDVGLDRVVDRDALARRVLAEAIEPATPPRGGARIVALRGPDRLIRGFAPTRLVPDAGTRAVLRTGGAYLITGGLGGVGLALAEHLLSAYGARVTLVGRRAEPGPDDPRRARLDGHAAAGSGSAAWRYVQGDVSDPERARAVVREAIEASGGLDAVFHAAGVLDDAPLMDKSLVGARAVMGPKVAGTSALAAALDALAPGACPLVLFGSISAYAGLAGQADYAAANAYLAAFAQQRARRAGRPTIAIAWPAWREVGMTAELERALQGQGDDDEHVHPLLGRCVARARGRADFVIELDARAHWVLDEHRARGGVALLPGSAYAEIARAAFARERGLRRDDPAVTLEDVAFVSPFVVGDDAPRELGLTLAERDDATEFGFWSTGADGRRVEHAIGALRTTELVRRSPFPLDEARRACEAPSARVSGHDHHRHIAFGPRWGALAAKAIADGRAFLRLDMPRAYEQEVSSFGLHPSLFDLACGSALELLPGHDPRTDFLVPVGFARAEIAAPLPARAWCAVTLRPTGDAGTGHDLAVFDVQIADDEGRIVATVDEFTMKRLVDLGPLEAAEGAPARAGAARTGADERVLAAVRSTLGLGTSVADGLDALERIVGAGGPPELAVSSRPLHVVLERLRGLSSAPGPGGAGPSTGAATAPRDPNLGRLETALRGHPAVADAYAVAGTRRGERRVVVFFVHRRAEEATVTELRRFVKGKVDMDWVPREFVELDALPRGARGEIDAAALPDPFSDDDGHVAPRTPTEKLIADIWQDVLGVKRVGLHDNFFDIGGHSLLAIRAITAVRRRTGAQLNQAIMVLQTLEQVARECDLRARPA
ncbi:MAG: SDR family oxidoreductase [Burkholderiales bacterium]|nr:SDR family oxidoreductase [Burkholderiales bacterium]